MAKRRTGEVSISNQLSDKLVRVDIGVIHTNRNRSNHTIIQFLIIFLISGRSNIDQSPLDIVLQRRDAFESDFEDVRVFELGLCVEDFDAVQVDD